MSIKLKLIIMFLAAALISALFVGVLTFNSYRRSLQASRLLDLNNILAFRTDKIESYFFALDDDMELARESYVIKKNLPILIRLASNPQNQEFLAAKLEMDVRLQQMQGIFGLVNIMLLNQEGKIVYSSDPVSQSKYFLNTLPDPGQEAFKEGRSKKYFTDIFPDKGRDNLPEMLVSAPVFGPDKVPIGVIAFAVDMAPVYKLIQDITGLGDTGETLVVKKIGNEVLYLNSLRHDPDSALKRKIPMGTKIAMPAQEAANGNNGAGIRTDYRGKEVIAAWHYLPSLGWGVVAKIDTREAFKDIANLQRFLVTIILMVLLISVVIAVSIARSISEPIKKLSKGAEMIGSGNLNYEIATDSKDEIGQLSRSFDKMTKELKATTASRDELNNEINERKIAELTLANERNNLQMIFDVVNVGMLLIDEGGVVRRINNIINQWVGQDAGVAGSAQAGDVLKCIHAVDGLVGCGHTGSCGTCLIRNAFESALRIDKPVHGVEAEVDLLVNNSQLHLWLDVSADPIVIDGKKHVILALNNITELKKAESVLERDKETLDRLVKEKTRELLEAHVDLERTKRLSDIGTLAATVAHELRNPLASIKLAAFNIKRKAKDAPIESNLANIDFKVTESEQIISNLLFYSKIKVSHPKNINISNILKACIEEALRHNPERGLTIEQDTLPIKDQTIQADPLQVKEVFANILNNSIDALPDKVGEIKIRAKIDRSELVISFEDNGEGIDEEHLAKVFDPFFTTKAKGTGLGLAVCKQIIQLHGGSIELSSAKGKGTTVTVTFPIDRKNNA